MKKLESLGWGMLCSVIGGIIVLVLLYFLYLKKKNVNLTYYILGFFIITIALFAILGTAALTGALLQQIIQVG